MNKAKKMRLSLAKLLKVYAEKPTTEGLTLVSEDDFIIGTEIFVLTDGGEIEVAPDGVFHTEDGTTYTVADGLIASIEEVSATTNGEGEEIEDLNYWRREAEIARKALEEQGKELADLTNRNKTLSEKVERQRKEVESITIENNQLKKDLEAKNSEIKTLQSTIESLEKTIAELSGKSGKPEVEETIEEEAEKEEEKFSRQYKNVELVKKFRK